MKVIQKPLEQRSINRFAFLNQTSVARWAPIPLRLIVGYGFMQHGFASYPRALKPSPSSCMPLAYPRRI